MLILEGELSNLSLLRLLEVGCYDIEIGWRNEVVALHQQLFAIVHQVDGSKVSIIVGHLLQLPLPVNGIEVLCSMPYANEVDHGIL